MKNNKTIFTVIILIGLVSLTGFFGYRAFILNPNEGKEEMRYFIDSRGRNLTVPQHPMRIISMTPSITEILFSLGVQDRLVGVTDYCNYPEEAKNITSIGGFSTPDLETIISLNPDLLIANSWNAESIVILQDAGFVVAVMEDSNTLDGVIDGILNIGDLVDADLNATNLAGNMYEKMWEVTNQTATINETSKVSLYFEIWESPMVVGNQSYINDMMIKAGGINIFRDLNCQYPVVSNEDIINANPDFIFITEHSSAWYSQELCNRTGYNIINACINNHVYTLDDDLFLRAGPRIIDALINMTNYLYPGLLN
ncbi:MAG: ABC transporter substrate-binding protein [Promethearchaeota archaeon]